MKKFIFDFITSPFSLFENPFYDYIAIAVIGYIAYKIAYGIVGDIGLRREAGSIAHWIIRFIVFITIWLVSCIIIKAITFIINNWIIVTICVIMLLMLYIVKKYADAHPNSILNKKLF